MADPVALDDSYEIGMDSVGVLLDVLANDFDPDGDPLVVVFVDGGPGTVGTFSISGDYQSVVYTPAPGWTGTEVAFYAVGNEPGFPLFFVGAEITIEVVAQIGNTDPVALDDAATTAEDTAVTISVLVNDTDADGDTLSVGAVTDGTFGSVIVNGDGTVTYTPDADFFGTDSFTYTASDGLGGSDTATVDVTVTPVSDAPVARDDAFVTDENAQLTGDVLADNGADPDLDVDGDTLTISLVADVTHGTLALNPDGTFSYDPNQDYFGTDSFTYSVSDGEFSDTATVTFTIVEVNDAPVARDDAFVTDEETEISGNLLADNGFGVDFDENGDILRTFLAADAVHGRVEIDPDGTFTYLPFLDFTGTDSFTYTLSDGMGGSDTGTVTVTVNPLDDAPRARRDFVIAERDTQLTGDVLADNMFGDDDEPDDEEMTVTLGDDDVAHGTLVLNPDGTFTYDPDAGYLGIDTFSYVVSDPGGLTDTQTVTIEVESTDAGASGRVTNFFADATFGTGGREATLGSSVASGDFNGDGYGDLLIGRWGYSPPEGPHSPGQTYLIFGREGGLPDFIDMDTEMPSGTTVLRGMQEFEASGSLVASAGDINNDGYEDILIGAEGYNESGTGDDEGRLYVIYGRAEADWTDSGALIELDNLGPEAGFVIAGSADPEVMSLPVDAQSVGDVNGDGIDDIAFSVYTENLSPAPDDDPWSNTGDAGSAYVLFGRDSTAGDSFESVINIDDIGVGTGLRFDGDPARYHDQLGGSVSGAGDVNNDGIDDLLVGAYEVWRDVDGSGSLEREVGSAYVIYGRSEWATDSYDAEMMPEYDIGPGEGFRLDGGEEGGQFGGTVAGIGDVNNDGIDDFAVNADLNEPIDGRWNSGSVTIIFGRDTGTEGEFDPVVAYQSLGVGEAIEFAGPQIDSEPVGIAPLGDVNGDGIDDFLIGAQGADYSGKSQGAASGSAYLILGREQAEWDAMGPLYDLAEYDPSLGFRFDGARTFANLAQSLSGVSDFNGDGFNDMLFGADGGNAFLVYGQPDAGSDGIVVVCFAGDTLIDTPDGARPAGQLRAGDLVMTRDHGAQPLVWTGGRSHQTAELAAIAQVTRHGPMHPARPFAAQGKRLWSRRPGRPSRVGPQMTSAGRRSPVSARSGD